MSFRWIGFAAAPLLALVLSTGGIEAQTPAKPHLCAPLVMSEYCFPGGDLAALVSIDEIMEQGTARAEELIAARSTPSRIEPARRKELLQMWREAVQRAYVYAQAHSHKLDSLTVPESVKDANGTPQNPLMETLSRGPMIRLNFVETSNSAFAFDGKVLLNRDRLLHFLQVSSQTGKDSLGVPMLFLSAMLGSVPVVDGYILLNSLLESPFIRPVALRIQQASASSDVSLMGALGMEMVMALSVAVEEAIRARSIELEHALHIYQDGSTTLRGMDSPQVLWNGHLLLSEEAISQFTQAEIELLMTHEAMHLMRPNFFLGISAADGIQRRYFPQLNTERTATLLSNLLGRPSPGKPSNCPIELADDDELFIDYYVFQLYRDQPEKQKGYFELLKRIHREFNPGTYSQAAFRVEFAETLMEHFIRAQDANTDTSRQNQLYNQAIADALIKNLPKYLSGTRPNLDDVLQEMELHPDIALDAQLMRVTINYYRRKALLKEGWETNNSRFTVSCEDIDEIFRMNPVSLSKI